MKLFRIVSQLILIIFCFFLQGCNQKSPVRFVDQNGNIIIYENGDSVLLELDRKNQEVTKMTYYSNKYKMELENSVLIPNPTRVVRLTDEDSLQYAEIDIEGNLISRYNFFQEGLPITPENYSSHYLMYDTVGSLIAGGEFFNPERHFFESGKYKSTVNSVTGERTKTKDMSVVNKYLLYQSVEAIDVEAVIANRDLYLYFTDSMSSKELFKKFN